MKKNQKTTREIIEECARVIQARHTQKQMSDLADETTVSDVIEDEVVSENEEITGVVACKTPRCFDAEYAEKFKELPTDWQEYLLNLDASLQNYCCEMHHQMSNLKWIEELFKMRDTSLYSDKNETPREWLEKLAYIEHMLSADPKSTLISLCKIYLRPENPLERELLSDTMPAYFKNRRQQMAKLWLDRRLSERNNCGAECYPHRKEVMDTIVRLLSSRLAEDVCEAYNMAVWMNKNIRQQMIDSEVCNRIRQKTEEAHRAKNALSMARTKGEVVAKPEREMTTREIVEMAFRKHAKNQF